MDEEDGKAAAGREPMRGAMLRWVERKENATSRWARDLKQRRHPNVAIVAMANKLARIAWAVMTTGKPFDPARGALAKGATAAA